MKPTGNEKIYKGLVMAIDKENVTVMTAGGEFLKTRFQGHEVIGDEIEFAVAMPKSRPTGHSINWLAAHRGLARIVAASFTIVAVTGVSWAYPVGQVYMDVNPSLGLSYNIYERVIGVKSYNTDGQSIEKDLSVYGKSIEAGVEETLLLMDQKGYVKENQSGVILGYSSDNQRVKQATVAAVTTVVEKVEKPLTVAEVAVNTEDESQAKTAETSPIKAALEKKEAKPVVNEKLNAAQKRLLEEQKKLEELKKKSENLTQKIDTAKAEGKLPPKAQKASAVKQAVIEKQIASSEKVVENLTQKIETIEEENTNIEEATKYQAATPKEKLALAKKAHEKLIALRKKILEGGVSTEAEKNRLKQVNLKIKQLEQLLSKTKQKEEAKPKKENGKKP